MLVKHPERRRVHDAVSPRYLPEFQISLVPEQRIARTGHGMDMRSGRVTMRLLVAADGNFRHMRMQRAIRQKEEDVHRSFAPSVPAHRA